MKLPKQRFYQFASHAIAAALSSTALLAISATAQAPFDVRVALIIGNSELFRHLLCALRCFPQEVLRLLKLYAMIQDTEPQSS